MNHNDSPQKPMVIHNVVNNHILPKIFHPEPLVTVVGAVASYLMASPSIPGLWGLAAAAATGLVVGIGGRWGTILGTLDGVVAPPDDKFFKILWMAGLTAGSFITYTIASPDINDWARRQVALSKPTPHSVVVPMRSDRKALAGAVLVASPKQG